MAGKSPVQNAGAVVTLTTFTNDSTGKTLDGVEIRYDGTLGGWQSVCSATVTKADTQGKPIFVAPGTTFAIPDPAAPVDPTPLPPAFLAWQAKWITYLQLARWASQDIPSATVDRVAQAKSDHEKAWDPSFEALL